jgi:hypothetical protein
MKQKIVIGRKCTVNSHKNSTQYESEIEKEKMVRASATSKIEQRRADTGNRNDWRKKNSVRYEMIIQTCSHIFFCCVSYFIVPLLFIQSQRIVNVLGNDVGVLTYYSAKNMTTFALLIQSTLLIRETVFTKCAVPS